MAHYPKAHWPLCDDEQGINKVGPRRYKYAISTLN